MYKALVVDDLNLHRTVVTSSLISLRFEVDTAEDGIQAMKKLATTKYDVIFSDIEMPNMNGFEFLTRVKRDVRLKSTPVIMLSTLKDDTTINRMKALGASSYLTKPFRMEAIRAAIQSIGLKIS